MGELANSSWKDEIITDKPEDQTDDLNEQSETVKELKADIVELIEDGTNSSQGIKDSIEKYPDSFIEQCLKDMKNEGVLEVI